VLSCCVALVALHAHGFMREVKGKKLVITGGSNYLARRSKKLFSEMYEYTCFRMRGIQKHLVRGTKDQRGYK